MIKSGNIPRNYFGEHFWKKVKIFEIEKLKKFSEMLLKNK